VHGGAAPQVKAKRLERIALAEALAKDPARAPADVLLDVAHQADYLMRTARAEVRAHQPTAATMQRLLDLTENAGRWAKTTLEAGTAERQIRVLEAHAALLYRVISDAVGAVLVDEEQRRRVLALVSEGLRKQNAIEASQ
jgi:hypothetical protein